MNEMLQSRKRPRTNSADDPSSSSSSQLPKRHRVERGTDHNHLPDGIHHVVNVFTGAYVALLDDNDRTEVVNISFGLKEDLNNTAKWLITHLGRDRYKIQNYEFKLFACHDHRPHVEDPIVGKTDPIDWTIKPAQNSDIYNISPVDTPDLCWASTSHVHGTPLELGQPGTAKRCRWNFEAVSPETGSRPQAPKPLSNKLLKINGILEKMTMFPSARYEADPRPKCLEGTRIELLETIRGWIADSGGRSVFWLRGQAGAGKTTIALTVADECESRKQLGATFIFSRDQTERSELRHVFPTISRQLARLCDQYASLLSEVLLKEGEGAEFVPSVQLERLIVQPLEQCEDFPSPIVIVLDALDECKEDKPVSTLLSAIQKYLHRIPMLRFFITSRPELHIAVAFNGDLQRETTSITLHDIESTKVDKDVALFIRTFLSDGIKLYPELAEENWPSENDTLELTCRSAQLFIYAATALRIIFDPEFDDPRAQLHAVLRSSTGVVSLDELYLDILTASSPAQARPENQNRLLLVLGVILVLASPLDPETLESLLGFPRGRVRTILRRLHSVLIIPAIDEALAPSRAAPHLSLSYFPPPEDYSIAPIRIIHPSFFDFLTIRCADDRFRVDVKIYHTQLALHCFERMRDGLRRNICQSDDSRGYIKDISYQIRYSFIPPTLRYACRYWDVHLRSSNGDKILLDRLEELLSQHLLHWMEVLAFLDCFRERGDQLRRTMSFVQHTFPQAHHRVSLILDEGSRLMNLGHARGVISCSTAHIYVAARLLDLSSLLRPPSGGDSDERIRTTLSAVFRQRGSFNPNQCDENQFRSLSLSPNGAYLASLGIDEDTIWIWHTATATLCNTVMPAHQPIWVQFLPDNARVVCGSVDGVVTIWEVARSQLVQSPHLVGFYPPYTPTPHFQYAADPDFKVFAILINGADVHFWDTQTWDRRAQSPFTYWSFSFPPLW